ncbi:NnrS family protein [Pseudomonadota bacterium]
MNIPLQASEPSVEKRRVVSLLALGFRPFFLVAGIFAVLLMTTFVLGLVAGVWHYNYFSLFTWHAHEMLFGYATAVIAGFLLTSVRNWTGMDTATGSGLLLLVLLWLAGRLASAISALPGWLIAAVDLSFLPILAIVISIPIIKVKQYRNIPVPLLLLLMSIGNALIYAEMLELSFGSMEHGMTIGTGALLLLMSVIGGRVMPFFTERGLPGVMVTRRKWVESTVTPAIVLWLLLELTLPASIWVAIAAIGAAVVNGIRLIGWGSLRIWQQPMLWIIHLAYAWLVAGFVMQGLAAMGWMSTTIALHGWTAGAIGLFTLGMMARVALGHTGRSITASPAMIFAFVLLALVAPVRVLLPLLFPSATETVLLIAAVGWISAFAVFVWVYTPHLVRSRADGAEG